MQNINLPKEIRDWFLARNVSEKVLEEAGIYFDGEKIVIPIRDINGQIIFNKYRRNPFSEEGPKYLYEKGATSSLFNIHTVIQKRNENIFITEGENDTLCMNSFGFNAISSTGGAGTFKEEWFEYIKYNNMYIVYDRDESGIRGAMRVQKMVPFAKIIWLPYDTKGKDVTDYFMTHSAEQFSFLVKKAESWNLPFDQHEVPTKKSEIKSILQNISKASEEFLIKKREYMNNAEPLDHFDVLFEMLKNRSEYWHKQLDNMGKINTSLNIDDITRAKMVPISNYIRFNNSGFACCLWHHEVHGSMKWYPERNKVYCYACNAHKDVLDVVMQQSGIDFNTALKIILEKQ